MLRRYRHVVCTPNPLRGYFQTHHGQRECFFRRVKQLKRTEGITAIILFTVRQCKDAGIPYLDIWGNARQQCRCKMTSVRHHIASDDVLLYHRLVDEVPFTPCLFVQFKHPLVSTVEERTGAA